MRGAALAMLLAVGLTTSGRAAPDAGDPRDAAQLERALAGRTTGKPLRCVDQSELSNMERYGTTILYTGTHRRLLRNDTIGHCAALGRGDILVTRSFGSQMCQGDIVTTADPTSGMMSGSCALGPFVPYAR